MERRTFLIWFGRAVYTTSAAIVAGAGARFLGAPLKGDPVGRAPIRRRLATLDSLPVGEPQLLEVRGVRQDAWTRYPAQVIGRVWATRSGPTEVSPAETEVTVFNAACPHSGCPIQKAVKEGYHCHCHGAQFNPDGSKVEDAEGFTNPSPRGMDLLRHHLVRDDATGRWWLEVEYREYEVGLADRIEKS